MKLFPFRFLHTFKNIIILKQIAEFSVVGIFVNVLSLILLYVFLYLLNSNVYLAYTSVSIICIGFSYIINAKMVFKASLNLMDYFRYNFIYVNGMLIGLVIIALVKYFFYFNDFINSIIATPFTTIWNFVFVKILLLKK